MTATCDHKPPLSFLLVVLLAFLCGFALATGKHATWQAPVENGQILAGLVHYPASNPYFIYLAKLWSLVNQASGLLLYGGMNEVSASILIVGVIGGISFSAITLVTLSICNAPIIALFAPLFMYHCNLVGSGAGYPIWLMGTTHSFGILGLSWSLLVIGLFGCGYRRSGAFALGLAPAVHPSLGSFCFLLFLAMLPVLRRTLLPVVMPVKLYLLAGVSVTFASFGWQRFYSSGLADLSTTEKSHYLENFIKHFDFHRSAAQDMSSGVLLALCAAALCLAVLINKDAPGGALLVARACSLSVGLALVLAALVTYLPVPVFLKVFMPWRYLNLANIALTPIIIGLFSASFVRNRIITCCAMPLFVSAAFYNAWRPSFPALYLYLFAVVALLLAAIPCKTKLPGLERFGRYISVVVTLASIILICSTSVLPAAGAFLSGKSHSALFFNDRTNNAFYKVISERPGMLLTAAELHLIPLATRRPVLLDGGALDFFNYVPESGPELNRILREVYGLDIFVAPPPSQRNTGSITDIHRQLWMMRDINAWRIIRHNFGVTDIIVPFDWSLQLPLVAASNGLCLYTIP